jgi:FKBP-type peptidyl-prolyl cis-trans isomerase FklB
MKKLILTMAAGLLSTSLVYAAPMSNQQKLSYTIGFKTGEQLNKSPTKMDPNSFLSGVHDGLKGSTPKLTPAQMQSTLQSYQKQMIAKLRGAAAKVASKNLAAANAFLASNAKKPGVKTIEPGLQYKVLTSGTGPKPTMTDSVKVDYEGKLINGKVFDSSYKRGKPITFKLNQVIPGWGKALTQMPQGSTWMIYISPKLAYGPQGAMGAIGPNEALIFKVHLISVKS